MHIGQKSTYTRTFTQEDFDRFAKLSGDDNPIHVDPEFSARTKFGKTVAHGMLLYSTIGRCLGTLSPGTGISQISQELKFPNPSFVGQTLLFQLEVVGQPSPTTAEISTRVVHEDGKLGCEGRAWVWLPGTDPIFNGYPYATATYQSEAEVHRGLEIGQSYSQTRRFRQEELDDFCDLVHEENKLIIDSGYAQNLGFKDVLLPGGMLGGTVSDILGTKLPGYGTNWLKQKYHFTAPAYPNEDLTTTVEIIRLRPEKDLVNLRTTITNHENDVVVDGEALVWVSDLDLTM